MDGNKWDDVTDAWEAYIKGDDEAFEYVFKAYYERMFGYGVKLCNQKELVKDCIQDLFKNIWRRRGKLDHINSPNVYLYVSLRRKILKKKKVQNSFNDNKIEKNYAVQFGKEEIIIKNEVKFQKKKELKDALNQLSTRQKEIVVLHFYNGMSYSEIEEILSINRQSIRNHIYRAMEKLRSFLGNDTMKLIMPSLLLIFVITCL